MRKKEQEKEGVNMYKARRFMGNYISVKKNKVSLHCDDTELNQKILKVLEVLENKLNTEWSYEDYIAFFKSFSKVYEIAFKDGSEELIRLLELSEDDLKERLIYLDLKLDLNLFNKKRCFSIKDNDIKMTFKPGAFSTPDIIEFYKKLYSEITKRTSICRDIHKDIIDKCNDLDSKKHETLVLLELLEQKDSDIYNLFIMKYKEWVDRLPEEDPIHEYLARHQEYIIELVKKHLRIMINEYNNQCEIYKHVREKKCEYKDFQSRERQRLNHY